MAPDPVCASCRGTFVEKLENPEDDPREFVQGSEPLPFAVDAFLRNLQTLVDPRLSEGRSRPSHVVPESPGSGNRLRFHVHTESTQRPNTSGPGQPPTMSEFIRGGSDSAESGTITAPLMTRYLMALLGQRDPLNELFGHGMGGPNEGRMGDYVFNQEALDQIISQIMENSNAHRPIPATEDIVSNLPREVLEQKSPLLEKDCAVCKEQFKLGTDDPDEQVVITLPCKHPFHEPCILPWLKSSGTCPVCRHALVPQPDQNPAPAGSSTRTNSDSNSRRERPSNPWSLPSRSDSMRDATGFFQSFFGGYGSNSPPGRNHGSSSRHSRSNSDPPSRSSGGGSTNSRNNIPGGWDDIE